ncbi:hypothetical protein B0H16DRAFT_147983 [Mycena metata]|uniref:Uncharacterized protein n=1 Tax=Mycena metata TaxID=1033252 RepID=A0AAD7NT32_9AGAR|nr:hypothetical protein B0H16DRAFT_147983 [Mycena metata]
MLGRWLTVSHCLDPNHNMLELPSSILGLSSLSKGFIGLFGGLYIGAQVAVGLVVSGLSVPKIQDSVRATRTTQTVLSPTKCVLSNDAGSFPYRAAFVVTGAQLLFICAIILSILRHPRRVLKVEPPSPATEPPSPPPQPGSSSSANKAPRSRWLWLLLSLVLMLLIGAGVYIYFTHPDTPVPLLVSMCPVGHFLSVIERHLLMGRITAITRISTCLSSFKNSISAHGSHYIRITGLALASHSGCVFLYRRSSRLRLHVFTRVTGSLNYYCGALFLGSVCFLALVPPLRWVLWGIYAYGEIGAYAVIPLEARGFLVYSISSNGWCSVGLEERAIVVGLATLHLAVAILIGLWCSVLPATRAFKRLAASIRTNPMLLVSFLQECVRHTTILTLCSFALAITWIDAEYLWDPRYERALSEHPWLSRLWWGSLQRVYEDYRGQYRAWKSMNVNYWLRCARLLLHIPGSISETWQMLGGIQKILIVAPAFIYYGYYHIIPATKKLPALMRKWRRRLG